MSPLFIAIFCRLPVVDVTFTGTGEGHSIEALGSEPVEMIALILYDKRYLSNLLRHQLHC